MSERRPFAVVRRDGIMALTGELDMAGARTLQEHAEERIAEGDGDVVLDLRELSFIDSHGVRAIVEFAQRLRPRRLILEGAVPGVATVLELTGLSAFSTIEIRPAD